MMWIDHVTADGQRVAKCPVCGSNASHHLIGTDEECTRCFLDALSAERRRAFWEGLGYVLDPETGQYVNPSPDLPLDALWAVLGK